MIESWHRPLWKNLLARVREDRVPHALLFHGPSGVGKRSVARRLAAALLCESPAADAEPCGSCRGCTLVSAETHPDYRFIAPEEDSRQIRIEQIRRLSERASLTSSRGRRQVFLLDPADAMNAASANAFLKTLEEPRDDSVIILIAVALQRLPVTILSRCQRVTFALPDRADALAYLADQGIDAAAAEELLEAAGGSPGQALELAGSELAGGFRETLADLEALASRRATAVEVAERWAGDAPDLRLAWMAAHLSRSAWQVARGQAAGGLTASGDLASLTRAIEQTHRTRGLLETSLRPKLLIEALLIDWLAR